MKSTKVADRHIYLCQRPCNDDIRDGEFTKIVIIGNNLTVVRAFLGVVLKGNIAKPPPSDNDTAHYDKPPYLGNWMYLEIGRSATQFYKEMPEVICAEIKNDYNLLRDHSED